MKKIKRIGAILLIFLLNINTLATSVTNNDGSAFITKAEFDALKSNFQAQIDTYNQHIDSKIDDAIASYLSGVKVSKIVTGKVITNDWDEVTCFNGSVDPTFVLPDTNLILNGTGINAIYDWGNNTGGYTMNTAFNWIGLYYDTTRTSKNIRPLVIGNNESALDQSANMSWNGIAYDYKENFQIARNWAADNWGFLYGDRPDIVGNTGSMTFTDATNILVNGYYPNWPEETSSVLSPILKWVCNQGSSTLATAGNEWGASNVSSVVLQANSAGEQTYRKHIIQYNGNTSWCVSNNNFTKTFRKHSNNSNTSKTLLNALSKTVNFDWMGEAIKSSVGNHDSGSYPKANVYEAIFKVNTNSTLNVTDTANAILPSIGMLSSDQPARKILQFESNKSSIFNGNEHIIAPSTLEKGLPLFYCEKNTVCIWEAFFKEGLMKSGSNWVNDTNNTSNQVKIMLSVGPFSDNNTTSKPINTTMSGITSTTQNISKTGSGKLSFTMPEDGIVYVKWWPNVTTPTSYNWCYTLDLAKCNSFTYELASK